eukprot:c18903_g1_i2.p1 GENE.c18903_g1_i2~~c18903_g1_i2.p1  ORF type:complete len:543 (+),score=139.25 c18903_g1_i2:65-1630(+)
MKKLRGKGLTDITEKIDIAKYLIETLSETFAVNQTQFVSLQNSAIEMRIEEKLIEIVITSSEVKFYQTIALQCIRWCCLNNQKNSQIVYESSKLMEYLAHFMTVACRPTTIAHIVERTITTLSLVNTIARCLWGVHDSLFRYFLQSILDIITNSQKHFSSIVIHSISFLIVVSANVLTHPLLTNAIYPLTNVVKNSTHKDLIFLASIPLAILGEYSDDNIGIMQLLSEKENIRCIIDAFGNSIEGLDYPEGSRRFYTPWVLCMALSSMCRFEKPANTLRKKGIIELLKKATEIKLDDNRLYYFAQSAFLCVTNKNVSIFGTHISLLPIHNEIPTFLSIALEYLYQNEGYLTEKIFRITIEDSDIIDSMRESIDQGNPNWIHQSNSFHDLAQIILSFFKELPEPIFTARLAESFLAQVSVNESQQESKLRQLVAKLPVVNRMTLARILYFFKFAALFEENNKMDETSFAVALAPNIFPIDENYNMLALCIELLQILMSKFEIIFPNFCPLRYEPDIRVLFYS